MFLVAIGECDNAELIKADIYRHFEEARREGLDIVYEDYYVNNALFISCGTKENILTRITDKKSGDEFRITLAKALTEVIIEHYEMKLLKKIVKANFFYLNDRERASVIDNACRLLKDEKPLQYGGLYRITRRSMIIRSILEYLDSENEFNIEGFVNFRLNPYISELNETIERALEIFVAEKEYNEFIKLLRYFVEIQECKVETVHLFQDKDGKYLLFDESGSSISSEYFDELKSEILDETINYDDLLISTLITISPKRITIHDIDSFRNKELIQTITNVFSERITVLSGRDMGAGKMESKETNNYSL